MYICDKGASASQREDSPRTAHCSDFEDNNDNDNNDNHSDYHGNDDNDYCGGFSLISPWKAKPLKTLVFVRS